MTRRYRVGRTHKRRGRGLGVVIFISLILVGGVGGFLIWDTKKNNSSGEVIGVSREVPQTEQVTQSPLQKKVEEPFYSFQLPGDWKEKERRNLPAETSISWQASKKGQDNRWLTLYIDKIPPNIAINRLLPIDAADAGLSYGQISDNCMNFTAAPGPNKVATPSKWEGVDFICDLPNFVQNKVGTGTKGTLNSTAVIGTKGKHAYFFVYTDHNVQPDYTILYEALKSFAAK